MVLQLHRPITITLCRCTRDPPIWLWRPPSLLCYSHRPLCCCPITTRLTLMNNIDEQRILVLSVFICIYDVYQLLFVYHEILMMRFSWWETDRNRSSTTLQVHDVRPYVKQFVELETDLIWYSLRPSYPHLVVFRLPLWPSQPSTSPNSLCSDL